MNIDSKVFLVDDDPSVRKSVGRLLRSFDFVVEEFSSANALLNTIQSTSTGCLVLDVKMPGLDGLDLQRELSDRDVNLPIVFITGHGDIPMSVKAIKAGAVDFIQKPFKEESLLKAVQQALSHCKTQEKTRTVHTKIQSRIERMTHRERDVFALVIEGLLNKQIGAHLGIAEKTVKVHRQRVMQKMEVTSVAELVRLAEVVSFRTEQSTDDSSSS